LTTIRYSHVVNELAPVNPASADHHVLRDVLRVVPITQHPQRDPVDPVTVTAHQHLVGIHIAGPRLVDQPPVGVVIGLRVASPLGLPTRVDLIGVVTMHRESARSLVAKSTCQHDRTHPATR
jgi:hypothetical protein